ncbi:2-succinylbenzoate--CoA ligase [Nostoc sp. FACHB-110]|uniref:2-succinylbenzoate--CoA ligase n=1 Tax=Nostoc sp. FACHB-110 TaxID=2692834 RepID=UPI00168953F6|nr:2-succinylbenzoate--CoA ligase [Nostoc sp. FACHB-110]MBD2435923.1 2-succinylbenzoate--CoA ligase [Nostoc sp. FACHB-110]
MEQPLAYLQNLPQNDWLICDHSQQFSALAKQLYSELTEISKNQKTNPKIILAERQPVKFLASFLAACAANCPVFLCNPDWGIQEWQQVFELVQPDIIWGVGIEKAGEKYLTQKHPFLQVNRTTPHSALPLQHSCQIMIPTGGSSGKIKFAIHTWQTLTASVQGFKEYFQLQKINSFCVLPIYHVSGLMQFIRSFTTNGQLVILPFKGLESAQIPSIHASEFFLSLVPTQLESLLQNAELTTWLAQFQTVMLGGAPAWQELLAKARFNNIRIAPTYGMTETASQIATLKPDDFLQGKTNSGRILPHAQVTICNQQGKVLNANQIGNITIQAKSLTLGYYPHVWENQDYIQVDDLGFLDEQGYLHIIGRSSDKIITGGENVYPLEIEAAIRETNMVTDVCVIGIPDKHWGQALTAIYVLQDINTSYLEIQSLLKHKLSKFKIPKHWICLESLPRNSQGKVNRQALQKIATEYLSVTK